MPQGMSHFLSTRTPSRQLMRQTMPEGMPVDVARQPHLFRSTLNRNSNPGRFEHRPSEHPMNHSERRTRRVSRSLTPPLQLSHSWGPKGTHRTLSALIRFRSRNERMPGPIFEEGNALPSNRRRFRHSQTNVEHRGEDCRIPMPEKGPLPVTLARQPLNVLQPQCCSLSPTSPSTFSQCQPDHVLTLPTNWTILAPMLCPGSFSDGARNDVGQTGAWKGKHP